MKLTVNSNEFVAPDEYTVSQLVAKLNIPSAGTAIAVNGKLVQQVMWAETKLRHGDDILIISAAYGG